MENQAGRLLGMQNSRGRREQQQDQCPVSQSLLSLSSLPGPQQPLLHPRRKHTWSKIDEKQEEQKEDLH
jgi:hypothetical protein